MFLQCHNGIEILQCKSLTQCLIRSRCSLDSNQNCIFFIPSQFQSSKTGLYPLINANIFCSNKTGILFLTHKDVFSLCSFQYFIWDCLSCFFCLTFSSFSKSQIKCHPFSAALRRPSRENNSSCVLNTFCTPLICHLSR